MAKIRKEKSGSFRHNPFKTFKGLPVSGKATSSSPPQTTSTAKKTPHGNDDELFVREMTALGLDRHDDEDLSKPVKARGTPAGRIRREEISPQDRELFLASLGKMTTTFRDETPDKNEGAHAAARRMRQLRRGKIVPEAEIDLHGLTRDEALPRVRAFLKSAHYQGKKTVLIITGRGNNSEEGPVLRGEVERFLSGEGRTWAIEWGRATARYGGEGAIVVFLRREKG